MSKNVQARHCDLPIGVLDSGVGGISVLRCAMELMPNEDFVYLGDLENAPYGEKSLERIKELTLVASEYLVSLGVKALLVACNTATSAAIETLRCRLADKMPVVGVEPALKPACLAYPGGTVAVMATPATLALNKFIALQERYAAGVNVISMPCPGLSRLIERTQPMDGELMDYLASHFAQLGAVPQAIVIGCTHYSFIYNEIEALLPGVRIFDGAYSTALRLRELLNGSGLEAGAGVGGVKFVEQKGYDSIGLLNAFLHRGEKDGICRSV